MKSLWHYILVLVLPNEIQVKMVSKQFDSQFPSLRHLNSNITPLQQKKEIESQKRLKPPEFYFESHHIHSTFHNIFTKQFKEPGPFKPLVSRLGFPFTTIYVCFFLYVNCLNATLQVKVFAQKTMATKTVTTWRVE